MNTKLITTALTLGGKAAKGQTAKRVAVWTGKCIAGVALWVGVEQVAKRGFEKAFDKTVEDKVENLAAQHKALQEWLRDNVVAQSELHANTIGYVGKVAETLQSSDETIAASVDTLMLRVNALEKAYINDGGDASPSYTN